MRQQDHGIGVGDHSGRFGSSVGEMPGETDITVCDAVIGAMLPGDVARKEGHISQEQNTLEASLHQEELDRARSWSVFVGGLSFASVLFTPYLGVPGFPRTLFAVSLVVNVLVSTWVYLRCRREQSYTPFVFRTFGYITVMVSFIVEWYLGVFSPTALVVTLGITFFGLGLDRRHAVWVCGVAILGYLILSLLTTFLVLPDAPVMRGGQYDVVTKMYFSIVGPFVMLGSLWMAVVSRRSMDEAMKRAIRAMKMVRQRDAELVEAQQELLFALEVGKGQPGRYTGGKAGRFILGSVIGRGGMGEVYYAREENLGREAAVKVLRRDVQGTKSSHQRFLQEAEIARKLESPNIVRVFDVGFFETHLPYIAMELLKGEELASRLRREGRLTLAEVADMIDQVALGLDEAHRAGFVHRDLKPQNIFYCETTGVWKILDFGVSKHTSAGVSLTGLGNVIGTPGFMAPEQATGARVDSRTDVFTLGAVAYRCVTGRQAFLGPDAPAVMFEIVYGEPTRPSEVCPTLTEQVDRVLFRAMEKEPAARYQSARAFAAALRVAMEENTLEKTVQIPGTPLDADALFVGPVVVEEGATGLDALRSDCMEELDDTRIVVKRRVRN